MKITIQVDGYPLHCDSRDPGLVARWLVEVFSAVRWSPATDVRMQVFPGFVDQDGARPSPDWIADSRIITYLTPVSSPQEFVEALQQQVNDYAELKR